ncbi:hypothetical protein SASPL_153373 [Salvia splendens]|uniref:Uncharacterized protein n=1 Tax=Salvia splendens TaxID=180675 RepID=A0A8X8W5D9_SALSN|nr:hypothetical protein SASPL_153373 [Salvia splendens]
MAVILANRSPYRAAAQAIGQQPVAGTLLVGRRREQTDSGLVGAGTQIGGYDTLMFDRASTSPSSDTKAGPNRKGVVAAAVVCGGRIDGPGGRDRVVIDPPR